MEERGSIPDSVRLQVYREEVRDNIAAFSKAIAAMWKAITVLVILFVLLGIGTIVNRQEVLKSREGNVKGRMVVCLTALIDNDRTFDMPAVCMTPDVTAYYPDEVCIQLDRPAGCGIRNDEN